MFVCLCKGITDTQIQEAVANGANTFKAVRHQLGVATQCCKCLPEARSIVEDALEKQPLEEALFYSAS